MVKDMKENSQRKLDMEKENISISKGIIMMVNG